MTRATLQSRYSSIETCEATGATYRQLDWWQRNGRLSLNGEKLSLGSGRPLFYSLALVVLVRAYVIATSVVDPQHVGGGMKVDARFTSIAGDISRIYDEDEALANCWLVIEPDSARIVRGDWPTDGALFVDLAACQRYVAEGIATS